MTTEQLIAEARAVLERMTPGEWQVEGNDVYVAVIDNLGEPGVYAIAESTHKNDLQGIAYLRNTAPALLDALDAAVRRERALREACEAGGRYCNALKRHQDAGTVGAIEGTDELETLFTDWHDKTHAALARRSEGGELDDSTLFEMSN